MHILLFVIIYKSGWKEKVIESIKKLPDDANIIKNLIKEVIEELLLLRDNVFVELLLLFHRQ